jgi:DNA-binding response OmpR family regulator
MNNSKPILQVEDDPNDVLFLELAMETAGFKVPVQVVVDGQQALDYLSAIGPFADREAYPEPSLVLLDLRIPKIPGLDVLRWLRHQPALKMIPVLILTSSDAERDIEEAYRLGADCYIIKPINPSDLLEIAKYIRDHWLKRGPKKLIVPKNLGRLIKRPIVANQS